MGSSLRVSLLNGNIALDMALNNEFPDGVRGNSLKLISGNGCQPTSCGFMDDMKTLEIKQIFTSYHNQKTTPIP